MEKMESVKGKETKESDEIIKEYYEEEGGKVRRKKNRVKTEGEYGWER